jgi:hypothetical protein
MPDGATYLLAWTADLRLRVYAAAAGRNEPVAVWIREAIRQRLEREDNHDPDPVL